VARITEEAIALIDSEGLESFSFRMLAARLGCQAMSIYHYFPSKAHLFEALVDILIAEAVDYPEAGTWQDRMRAAAGAYRKMALRHPGFFLYFGTFRLNNRSGLGFLERILRIFEASGLAAEHRARHFRIMGYYLVGACIDETIGYAKGPSATNPVPFEEARRDFPAIMAVGPYFGVERHKQTFDAGIDILIAGIEADLKL
jgi:AcrR family transcriptional regulator